MPDHPNIDPAIFNALKIDSEDYWKVGDPPAMITTHSGSIYHVSSDGEITGGTHLDAGPGKLQGSCYRPGGPIRLGVIVYGLHMEISREGKSPVHTSVVEKIEDYPPVNLFKDGMGY